MSEIMVESITMGRLMTLRQAKWNEKFTISLKGDIGGGTERELQIGKS